MVHTFPSLFSIIPEKEPQSGPFFNRLTGLGHTFGVRVDGASPRRFLRFLRLTAFQAEGCGIAPWAMSFISRLRRSRQHRVSILSAYLVHPFPLRGTSPQGETRALRDWLSISYGMIGILLIDSLRSPPPIRLRRTSPRESVSHDSQVASLPYESCSLATPVQGAE